MIEIEVTHEKMKEWFPKTYKTFLEDYRNSKRKYVRKAENKIEWLVTYKVNIPKAKNDEEAIQNQINYEKKLHLTYEERCKVDLPKIKIDCHMYAGYYSRSDRSFDKVIPKYIIDMFHEVMKITMLQEQLYVNDPIVLKSLEGFQDLFEQMMEDMGLEIEDDEENFSEDDFIDDIEYKIEIPEEKLDMDEILDKISEHGVKSLTAKELKFLAKMSKE